MKSDPRLNWHFESSSRYSGCLVVYRVRLIDFPDRLVVNWAYSSRRRRVRLVNSPDRLVVIRLVAIEFVSSTRETDSSRITPLRLVKCRVRLVVDQFHLQISKKYRSWEGPRTWFSCKMAAVDNRERSLDDLNASLRDGVQHLIARLSEGILADEDGIDYLCTHINRLLNLLTRASTLFSSLRIPFHLLSELVKQLMNGPLNQQMVIQYHCLTQDVKEDQQ